jgi:serine/threonine protein kinase
VYNQFGWLCIPGKQQRYILTEFCDPGSLHLVMKTEAFEAQKCWQWLRDMFRGLEFMHRHKFIHNDIKAGNLFIKGNEAKLGDFGMCEKLVDEHGNAKLSTLACEFPIDGPPQSTYSLAQLSNGDPKGYSFEHDMYCCGLLIKRVITWAKKSLASLTLLRRRLCPSDPSILPITAAQAFKIANDECTSKFGLPEAKLFEPTKPNEQVSNVAKNPRLTTH